MTKTTNTKFIVTVGIFSGIAFLLQFIGSVIGLKVGGFLEIEFSDLPALILSFFYGPIAGVACEFIKNLLHCTITSTGFVGELANFVINGIMCFTVGMIYKRRRTFRGAVIALVAGVTVMSLSGIFTNLYIMLPLYMPTAPISQKISLVLYTILPFNIARGTALSVITMLVYKRVGRLMPR